MDWSNETYVRLYIRDTTDDLELTWEALALWHMLLRKFDRSGLLKARKGWNSVALATRMPVDVVQRAGAELVSDGRVREVDGGFFAPNYIDAQTASKSDKARQKESRDRRRQEAVSQAGEITNASHDVSRDVTSGHAESQDVTLCFALPCDALSLSGKPDAAVSKIPEPETEKIGPAEILAETAVFQINHLAGTQFKANSKSTMKLCRALVRAKHTPDEAREVIVSKRRWLKEPDMKRFFQPSTLLALENFEKYLDELEGRRPTSLPAVNSNAVDDFEPMPVFFEKGAS